jgi:predicted phosphohydrolase
MRATPRPARVWAIADLHLSFANPGRRERYAARWRDHAAKIETNWNEVVRPNDLVVLPGDLSMARNHRELQPDLMWLDRLPGTKVISPGNHDAWWNGVEKIRPLLRGSIQAVGGNAIAVEDVIICGCRGTAPVTEDLSIEQEAIALRELSELDEALKQASQLRSSREQAIIMLWHYPPFDAYGRPGPCVSRFESAGVTACVYGHLHIEGQWSRAMQGTVRGVRYYCVAADAVGFRPLRLVLG